MHHSHSFSEMHHPIAMGLKKNTEYQVQWAEGMAQL
jgi:hypothetical protein